MPTKRDQILDNLVTTLQGITIANGYAVDMGEVSREPKHWNEVRRFPAVFIISSDETPSLSDTNVLMNANWNVGLLVYVRHKDLLSIEIEKVIGDIRKSVLVDEERGGLAIWTKIDAVRPVTNWLKPIGVVEFDLTIQYRYSKSTP